jgi:hypothetical protein
MEIPEVFDGKLRNRIIKWRDTCFTHRMDNFKDTMLTDTLFEEAENILAQIDLQIFKTKRVTMRYR